MINSIRVPNCLASRLTFYHALSENLVFIECNILGIRQKRQHYKLKTLNKTLK